MVMISQLTKQASSEAMGPFIYYVSTFSNQIRVVAFNVAQLTQASFLQKNQMLQNVFWYL